MTLFYKKIAESFVHSKKVVPLHPNLRWREVSLRKKGWILDIFKIAFIGALCFVVRNFATFET